MIGWIALMTLLPLLGCGSVLYLAGRVMKFSPLRALGERSRWGARALAMGLVLVPLGIIWLMWGSMNAVIVLLHFAIFWLICDGVFRLFRGKKPASRRYWAGVAAALVSVSYLTVGFVQANHVWKKNYTVETDKAAGSFRVALIADSHMGTTFDGAGFRKKLEQIQAESPDILVIAGDFVDEDSTRADMLEACAALGDFETPYGVYFAFGNHDKGLYTPGRDFSGDDLVAALEENGVTVLQDESVVLDGRIALVGRKDASEELNFGGSRAGTGELLAGIDPALFTVVLDHQPREYDDQAAAGADLVLSGHTHGGQLFPLMQLMALTHLTGDERAYGTETRLGSTFVVTSGISDWAIQFKTGCRSEFVIIDIQGK